MSVLFRRFTVLAAASVAATSVSADSAVAPGDLSSYADPDSVVLAVRAYAGAAGGAVRLSVYEDEEHFLTQPAIKHGGYVDDDGVAAIPLYGLEAGAYAFVAYYDRNGDGRLNRNALGKPTEPFAFSNGVRPKMRKPRFDEARVEVEPGDVILISLD